MNKATKKLNMDKAIKELSENITGKYILKDKKPVPEPDIIKWGKWIENFKNKVVKQEYITINKGKLFEEKLWISTVFLGLDHGFSGIFHKTDDPPYRPILFETMIFYKDEKKKKQRAWDWYQKRYCTWEEAEQEHKKTVAILKSGKIPNE